MYPYRTAHYPTTTTNRAPTAYDTFPSSSLASPNFIISILFTTGPRVQYVSIVVDWILYLLKLIRFK